MKRAAPIVLVLALLPLLAGCVPVATPGGGVPLPDPNPAADGPVLGQGTVIQVGDAPAQLCLGAVAESYPPQCSGPEMVGWDWSVVDLKETASDVTWGAFAVTGLWDGERFELTEPAIPLALYDPAMQEPDPRSDPATPGNGTEAQLDAIQRDLLQLEAFDLLVSGPNNGYLFVTVIYDDGSLQEYVDEEFGPDLVAITSALVRP